MDDIKKIDQVYENNGNAICPICGDKLTWTQQEAASCLLGDRPYDDPTVVNIYNCPNCGAYVEAEECPRDERHNYPFWDTLEEQTK